MTREIMIGVTKKGYVFVYKQYVRKLGDFLKDEIEFITVSFRGREMGYQGIAAEKSDVYEILDLRSLIAFVNRFIPGTSLKYYKQSKDWKVFTPEEMTSKEIIAILPSVKADKDFQKVLAKRILALGIKEQ